MISRPIKEGFRGVARHWAMSISAAIAVTITLTIISLFLIFTYHLQSFTKSVETSMEIYAGISDRYDSKESEETIRSQIEKIDGVKSITFSDKEAEFDYYISAYDEETKEVFEPFREENPMLDAFYIEVTDGSYIEEVSEQIRNIRGIDKVEYGGQGTITLVSAMTSIRRFGSIFVIALCALAIFLIQNTIQLTIYARQDEITIMRNVGATNGFIRAPFVWEGIITGILGAIIPIALTIYGYMFIYDFTGGVFFSSMFRLVKPDPFALYLSGILLVIGIIVGFVGSYMSVTKYLREMK